MRVSDDRYCRDRLRLDLALRLIRHEARTHTIRVWTGLTEDRVRKLFRTYLGEHPDEAIRRHRGKSPRQPAYFLRSPRMQQEAAVLAGICCMFGVIEHEPPASSVRRESSVTRGELLCLAFETYRALVPTARISIEHAVFLVTALSRGEELVLRHCAQCDALVVRDPIAFRITACNMCGAQSQHLLLRSRTQAAPVAARGVPMPARLRVERC